jgi:hypothetical protein
MTYRLVYNICFYLGLPYKILGNIIKGYLITCKLFLCGRQHLLPQKSQFISIIFIIQKRNKKIHLRVNNFVMVILIKKGIVFLYYYMINNNDIKQTVVKVKLKYR